MPHLVAPVQDPAKRFAETDDVGTAQGGAINLDQEHEMKMNEWRPTWWLAMATGLMVAGVVSAAAPDVVGDPTNPSSRSAVNGADHMSDQHRRGAGGFGSR